MGQGRKGGDWARFFEAVSDDLTSEWLDVALARIGGAPLADQFTRATQRKIVAPTFRVFARALDHGFRPADHARVIKRLRTDGYLTAFPMTLIAEGYRNFERLMFAHIDRFFRRRSPERRAAMCRHVADLLLESFAHVAAARVQMETDALHASEERFRTMIDAAGEAIFLVDAATGHVEYANGAAGRLFKTTPAALVGLGIDELVPKRSQTRAQARLADLLGGSGARPRTVRIRLLRTTGEPFDAAISVVRLESPDRPTQLLGVMRDVTAEKARVAAVRAHAHQLQRINEIGQALTATFDLDEILHRIVESAREVVPCAAASLLLLEQGRIVFREALGPRGHVVRKFTLALGEGIAGWVVEHGETLIVDDAQADPRLDRQIEEAVQFPVLTVLCIPLRTEHRVLGAIELLNRRGGPFTRADADLAEAFAAFGAIALDKALLFEERAALRQQLLQAEAATHAGRLASTIAQEMIDPITILKNELAIAQSGSERATAETFTLIGEELERLNGIVRMLVNYANSTAERVRPTPLRLLLGDVMASLQPEVDAAGVEVAIEETGPLPPVAAVPTQVSVAMTNLVRHALTVTPAGETVRVRLQRHNGSVKVSVSDQGAPLTAVQIRTLVDPKAVQRGVLAKGLDLYIAAALVRHHGGVLRGRGHRERGTTFSFTLPVATGEEAAWLTPS